MGHDTHDQCDSTLRTVGRSGLLVFALLSSGCAFLMPDRIHHVVDPSQQPAARCEIDDGREVPDRIVGIALSGGGSRAAVFSSAVLEALSEHDVLGQVTHISSVSGGSLASSHFLVHPSGCEDTASPEAANACWGNYFSEFKEHMRASYQTGTLLRNSVPWRFGSPTRRAISLQEGLDKEFLGNTTFGELQPHPVLMINATSYDQTRRFVFSNVCFAEGGVELSGGEDTGAKNRSQIMAESALEQRHLRAFTFSRPDCTRPAPNDLPVSLAVVASASFPPAIGPVSIQTPSGCGGGDPEWWHLGDGGVIENSGADSLEEVILRRLADPDPPLERALILSADASAYLDPDDLQSRKDFSMYTDPALVGLVVDSPRARGQAFHDMFWVDLLDELKNEEIDYEKLTFRHTEADLDELPDSCVGKITVAEIPERLSEIPTEFGINECSADLLEMAAHQLVHETFNDATLARLNDGGFPIQARRDCAMAR